MEDKQDKFLKDKELLISILKKEQLLTSDIMEDIFLWSHKLLVVWGEKVRIIIKETLKKVQITAQTYAIKVQTIIKSYCKMVQVVP